MMVSSHFITLYVGTSQRWYNSYGARNIFKYKLFDVNTLTKITTRFVQKNLLYWVVQSRHKVENSNTKGNVAFRNNSYFIL